RGRCRVALDGQARRGVVERRVRRVLDRDDLGLARAVAGVVGRGPRPRQRVVLLRGAAVRALGRGLVVGDRRRRVAVVGRARRGRRSGEGRVGRVDGVRWWLELRRVVCRAVVERRVRRVLDRDDLGLARVVAGVVGRGPRPRQRVVLLRGAAVRALGRGLVVGDRRRRVAVVGRARRGR